MEKPRELALETTCMLHWILCVKWSRIAASSLHTLLRWNIHVQESHKSRSVSFLRVSLRGTQHQHVFSFVDSMMNFFYHNINTMNMNRALERILFSFAPRLPFLLLESHRFRFFLPSASFCNKWEKERGLWLHREAQSSNLLKIRF